MEEEEEEEKVNWSVHRIKLTSAPYPVAICSLKAEMWNSVSHQRCFILAANLKSFVAEMEKPFKEKREKTDIKMKCVLSINENCIFD